MHTKTISELSRLLQDRSVSSVELTRHFLERIKNHDPGLNSFVTLTEELALAQARAADRKLQAGEGDSLTGVPLAYKDIFCTEGVRTSCGSKILENFVAPYDATVIERLNAAGAVMLGKTNMDEFAMGSSNENSHFGSVRNPWDRERVPGGSSGGSAAAVAARLAPGALGTDTGGSVRQPAALCGISGLKPTYGRVSRYGLVAFASSLDQAGPLARSAEDCALLLQSMAGLDARDSTSIDHEVPDYLPDYRVGLQRPLAGLKIGLPEEYFGDGLDDAIAVVIEQAADALRGLGATIKKVSLPNTHLAVPVYYVLAPAECSSNLARFDGVRYGYRCENPEDLADLYTRTRAEGFGAEVKLRIMIGTYALSTGYFDAYYLKAQKIRRLIKDDFQRAFEEVDLLLGPTSPTTAFRLDERVDDPVTMYLSDIYTVGISLAGLPAISVPAGFSDGLPVGLQLVGDYFAEAQLLNAAHQFQQATDWHRQAPDGF